jgi:hypothetical protein
MPKDLPEPANGVFAVPELTRAMIDIEALPEDVLSLDDDDLEDWLTAWLEEFNILFDEQAADAAAYSAVGMTAPGGSAAEELQKKERSRRFLYIGDPSDETTWSVEVLDDAGSVTAKQLAIATDQLAALEISTKQRRDIAYEVADLYGVLDIPRDMTPSYLLETLSEKQGPYTVIEEDGEFCVYETDAKGGATGEAIDCFDTAGEASAAIADLGGEVAKGGQGSGYFGHAGRPGEVGGSAPDGGSAADEESAHTIGSVTISQAGKATVTSIVKWWNGLKPREKAGYIAAIAVSTPVLARAVYDVYNIRKENPGTSWTAATVTKVQDMWSGMRTREKVQVLAEAGVRAWPVISAMFFNHAIQSAMKEELLLDRKTAQILERLRLDLSDIADLEKVFTVDELREMGIEAEEGAKHTGETILAGGLTSFVQKDGRVRWVKITSGGFLDRDQEIVSTAFLQSAVDYGDQTKERGPLRMFHIPGVDVGSCDFQAVVGRPGFLVESGLFDRGTLGEKAATWFADHPDCGMSIKFLFANRSNGIYLPPGIILERSILPADAAAFPWSATTVKETTEMSIPEVKVQFLKDVFGDAEAERILKEIESKATGLQGIVAAKAAGAYKVAPAGEGKFGIYKVDDEGKTTGDPVKTFDSAEEAKAELDKMDKPEGEKPPFPPAQKAADVIEAEITEAALDAIRDAVEKAVADALRTSSVESKESVGGLTELRAAIGEVSADLKKLSEGIKEYTADLPRAAGSPLYRASKAATPDAEEPKPKGLVSVGMNTLYGDKKPRATQ